MQISIIDPSTVAMSDRPDFQPVSAPAYDSRGELPGALLLCERKRFKQVLCSPWGWVMLLISPLCIGVSVLALACMHFLEMPGRVWVRGGRLFADRRMPGAGVELRAIQLELVNQQMIGATANRYLRLHYRTEAGKKRFLPLNEIYFREGDIDRVVLARAMAGD